MHIDPASFCLGVLIGFSLWGALETLVLPTIMRSLRSALLRPDGR